MANLRSLPPELLESIFRFLGSIDDVHSLGRVCRKTHDVIQRHAIYVDIMRSIIGQAPQHRYDLQLCKMLDLHKDIVEYTQRYASSLSATQADALGFTFNDWENALALATTPSVCEDTCCRDCLSDETVYIILARYQGLRVLEDIWLERQLNASDYFSADESPEADALTLEHAYRVVVNRSELYRDEEISSRNCKTPETAEYKTLNADQRGRFYSAVTYVWLVNELRWVLTNFNYPSRFDVQIILLENCKDNLSGQRREPMLDELDQYAMFKFIYHHLLPVNGVFLADKGIAGLPFTFSSHFSKDFGYTTRLLQLFSTAGQTYFQPPDLIDLIVRCKVSRRAPYPLVKVPSTTVTWQRPSQAFAFPRTLSLNFFDERCKRLLQQASLTHLNLIARSSFHQTRHNTSPPVNAPSSPTEAYTMRDHADAYFLDRAMVAFEVHENPSSRLRNIRDVFPGNWDDAMWCIWWWANSENKARAKMERWRKEPVTVQTPTQEAGVDAL